MFVTIIYFYNMNYINTCYNYIYIYTYIIYIHMHIYTYIYIYIDNPGQNISGKL